MKVVRTVQWEYTLIEGDGEERFIDVLCGTSAMFPRRVVLRPDEYASALGDEAYARELTLAIRRNPSKFEGRYQDNPPNAFGQG